MEKLIATTKDDLFTTLGNMFDQLEEQSKLIDQKNNQIEALEIKLKENSEELESFKKVSFYKHLTKQVEDRNEEIEILKKRISTYTKALERPSSTKSNKSTISTKSSLIKDDEHDNDDDDDDVDEDDDIWVIRAFSGKDYLYNTETKKIHLILDNEKPGDIVGRITSKDKFKKYEESKEYSP